jgi:hypothetical protein
LLLLLVTLAAILRLLLLVNWVNHKFIFSVFLQLILY